MWPFFNDIEKGIAAEPSAVHRAPAEDLLAVGDRNGTVKMMNYPAVFKEVFLSIFDIVVFCFIVRFWEQAPSFKKDGHVKEVSKVRFSCDGRFV